MAGKPLIAWAIETAISCQFLERVIVTTDDHEIVAAAREYGAEVPFIRPKDLAMDDTPDLPVAVHALTWLKENENYCPEIFVWLRPTAPLRTVEDIACAVKMLIEKKADSVRSVCSVEHHPYWMKKFNGDCIVPFIDGIDENIYFRRQNLPTAYRVSGAVDVAWCHNILNKKSLFGGDMYGYIMPCERSIDIDTETDIYIAEILIRERLK